MGTKADLTKEQYIKWVKELYQEVKKWIKKENLLAQEKDVEINEEIPGRYKAPGLSIKDKDGKRIAELRPVGAWIIGAKGRVDVIGSLDQTHLVYIEPPGPGITTTISTTSEELEKKTTLLFRGVNLAGWYWIEDKRRGKAHLLDAKLFMELLAEVSDYGL